jgi:hypothetical protein
MHEQGSEAFKKLKIHQKTLIILAMLVVISPPLVVMFLDLPPAAWLNAQQSRLFGVYIGKLTLAILIFLHGLLLFAIVSLIAVPVKVITGKTVLEWIRGKGTQPATLLTNIREEYGDEHADLCVKQEWLDQRKKILVVSADARHFRLQLNEAVLPGTQLRISGKGRNGGDLYLHVRLHTV